ncbi:hypothetical protein MRX96_011228 [Rhipicephalus microplus]
MERTRGGYSQRAHFASARRRQALTGDEESAGVEPSAHVPQSPSLGPDFLPLHYGAAFSFRGSSVVFSGHNLWRSSRFPTFFTRLPYSTTPKRAWGRVGAAMGREAGEKPKMSGKYKRPKGGGQRAVEASRPLIEGEHAVIKSCLSPPPTGVIAGSETMALH